MVLAVSENETTINDVGNEPSKKTMLPIAENKPIKSTLATGEYGSMINVEGSN